MKLNRTMIAENGGRHELRLELSVAREEREQAGREREDGCPGSLSKNQNLNPPALEYLEVFDNFEL